MFRPGGLTVPCVGKLLDVASSVDEGIQARAEVAAPAAAVDTRWVTEVGRAVLVFVPCYTIMGPRFSTGLGIAAASLLAAVWLICLRSAFAAVHFTLGLPIRTAVGTATGFVGASAVAL
jgi:hypothetical protein